MNTPFLVQPELESCIRTGVEPSAKISICSAGDLYFALEAVRKDSSAGDLQSRLCAGQTPFDNLCRTGRVFLIPLTLSSLVDGAFIDPYSEDLQLDSMVFQANAPEDSVRQLNMKEADNWGWNV